MAVVAAVEWPAEDERQVMPICWGSKAGHTPQQPFPWAAHCQPMLSRQMHDLASVYHVLHTRTILLSAWVVPDPGGFSCGGSASAVGLIRRCAPRKI